MIRTHRLRSILHCSLATLAAMLLWSCEAPVQLTVADVNPGGWEEAATIVIENRDTVALRDIELFVRSAGRFAEDTLSVRIVAHSPDSLRCEERLLLTIPQRARSATRIRERVTPYRRRAVLPRTGPYRLTIAPVRPAHGIEAVGVRIVASDAAGLE